MQKPATLSKKRLWHRQVFYCEFCEISKNTFFHRSPRVAASERLRKERKFTSEASSFFLYLCSGFCKVFYVWKWKKKISAFSSIIFSEYDWIPMLLIFLIVLEHHHLKDLFRALLNRCQKSTNCCKKLHHRCLIGS